MTKDKSYPCNPLAVEPELECLTVVRGVDLHVLLVLTVSFPELGSQTLHDVMFAVDEDLEVTISPPKNISNGTVRQTRCMPTK